MIMTDILQVHVLSHLGNTELRSQQIEWILLKLFRWRNVGFRTGERADIHIFEPKVPLRVLGMVHFSLQERENPWQSQLFLWKPVPLLSDTCCFIP